MPGPLTHIRVLDLSRVMAGPWAGQLLADLGADVVKVERPVAGDDTRGWGPPFLKNHDGSESGDAGYFVAVNRGKRSITVDLASESGQQVIRALAARSDILLENYKVGTLPKFGLGPEELRGENPQLIYCSITGFGQTGPRRDQVAYDFMIQAMGGLMSITGERDDQPGGGPQKVGIPIVDILTGMYAVIAALAALARRSETGRGDYIDIGMLDVMAGTLANQAMNYLMTGAAPRRTGNKHPNIQPQDVFQTKDGHVALAVGNDGQFRKFCTVIERPELSCDERFAANAGRVRNLVALRSIIQEILLTRPTADWTSRLDAAGIPCGPINSIAGVFQDPQIVHRAMLAEVQHPTAGTLRVVSSPMRFAEAPITLRRHPPSLGEHTIEILEELGLDELRRLETQ